MNLFTCCPKCQTTFRVTTQQLQSSGGQVRCGFCSQVFDAFATLTAQEPRQQTGSAPDAPQDPIPASPPVPSMADPFPENAPTASISRADPAAGLYEWEFRMPVTPKRTGMWLGLSALLLVLLGGQAAYVFRTELSVALPQTRGLFDRACDVIGCSMASPSLSSFLHIEASDLKAVDAAVPNEIALNVSIRSRAPVDLPHPAIELTLTDAQDQAIARRVFLPREYLPGETAATSIRPGAELPLNLFLNTGELRAAGYRLYLFYP
ncbi:MAG TPA: zinc-ribbon and DUF3426 domain-containing protein [Burkholderiales bacterium]|nr:zinc-ribbon and DUF3426 domain-containing protein [Burkholderiales bacterium]